MLTVADYLLKAAEFERVSNEATRPSVKKHSAIMAGCYRYLAREQSKIDESGVATAGPP
jgi:hypothetical protein